MLFRSDVASLGLTGHEVVTISGVDQVAGEGPLPLDLTVRAGDREFTVRARIDTPFEREVFLAGGILPYTIRALAGAPSATDR